MHANRVRSHQGTQGRGFPRGGSNYQEATVVIVRRKGKGSGVQVREFYLQTTVVLSPLRRGSLLQQGGEGAGCTMLKWLSTS